MLSLSLQAMEADLFEMFAEQPRLGNHSGVRQAQLEIVENRKTARQDSYRAGLGPPEARDFAVEPAAQGQQTQSGRRKERVADMEIHC